MIQSGDNQYKADAIIGVTETGKYVYYGLSNMEPATFEINKSETPTYSAAQDTALAVVPGISDGKIIARQYEEYNPKKKGTGKKSLQEQDAVSDRELLANTPLDAARNDGELRRLGDYKKQLDVFFTAQDALNIDLMSFDAAVYRMTLGGDLETVKRFIERACAACHVELTTLIVPGLNDSEAEMRALSGWIASLPNGEEIPLHITRFFPRYRMRDRAATERRSVLRLAEIAKEALKFVYTGNMQYLAYNEGTRPKSQEAQKDTCR